MFHKSKLFFWTTEVLLLTIIFFIWRQMDGLISPFVSVLNNSFSNCGIFVLCDEPISEIFGERAEN